MGFEAAKWSVVEALRQRRFRHEYRAGENKNLLQSGLITIEEAIALIQRTRGVEATNSPHHFDRSVEVWVFKPGDWYIKFYFKDLCWFVSFHRKESVE